MFPLTVFFNSCTEINAIVVCRSRRTVWCFEDGTQPSPWPCLARSQRSSRKSRPRHLRLPRHASRPCRLPHRRSVIINIFFNKIFIILSLSNCLFENNQAELKPIEGDAAVAIKPPEWHGQHAAEQHPSIVASDGHPQPISYLEPPPAAAYPIDQYSREATYIPPASGYPEPATEYHPPAAEVRRFKQRNGPLPNHNVAPRSKKDGRTLLLRS